MGIYGSAVYGVSSYGLSSLPASEDWEVFDFCEPTDASMGLIFAFSEIIPLRTFGPPYLWLDVNKVLWVYSDDGIASGLEGSFPVNYRFSLQFEFIPKQLPFDFTDLSENHFFAGVYNRFGKMAGVALSENGGIAFVEGPEAAASGIAGSAELFAESPGELFTLRLVADSVTRRGHLYLTRTDLIPVLGLELRYTFDLLDTPAGIGDKLLFSVKGSPAAASEIGVYCLRFSNELRIPNERPVAIAGPDQTVVRGTYAGFDGRESYDPEGVTPLDFLWTTVDAPVTSSLWIEGQGVTSTDVTGYTNRVEVLSGNITEILPGDLFYIGESGGVVVYVGLDFVLVTEKVFLAGQSVSYRSLNQHGWGGDRLDDERVLALARRSDPPLDLQTGDTYLVIAPATGVFFGQEDKIAVYSGSWQFTSPTVETLLLSIEEGTHYRYVGGTFPAGGWQISQPLPWELGVWSGRRTAIGTFLPDITGSYGVELLVHDGVVFSLPSSVSLSVQETAVPFGILPDLGWIWNYLPDFWSLFDDKEKVTAIWNGFAQVASGLLLEAWQHDYAKAVLDIQRIFQRRWLSYSAFLAAQTEENYTIFSDISWSGYAPTPGTEEFSYDTGQVLSSSVSLSPYLLVLGENSYRIVRHTENSFITQDSLPTADRPVAWNVRPVVVAESTNFEQEGVSFGDTAIFTVLSVDGTSEDKEAFVYGARRFSFAFDASTLLADLQDATKIVRFSGVRRRSYVKIYEYLVGIPRLQEALDRDNAPESLLLHQNKDFIVETIEIEQVSVNRITLWNSFFTEVAKNETGTTTGDPGIFETPGGLHVLFGVMADLSAYFLSFGGRRYRLKRVLSDTQLELYEDSLAPGQSGTYGIYKIVDPPQYLWAEVSYLDNRPTIEANFGRLVGLGQDDVRGRSDGLDYLSAVQGLWYTYWFGPKPYNIRVGSQILLGLPFAEQAGTVVDIDLNFDASRSRILVQDEKNTSLIRSYFFPQTVSLETNENTGSPYAIGDRVEQFAPLCTGVEVKDYISHPDWFAPYVRSGDFFEVWKMHTFGIVVNSNVFSLKNLEFVMSYVLKIKPKRTRAWFVVEKESTENLDVLETYVAGPLCIADSFAALPTTWPEYPTPLSWVNSPWEERVTRTTPPTFNAAYRWPTGRYLGPSKKVFDFGNLHFFDAPGRVPDGWSGSQHEPTRGDGCFMLGDVNGHGVSIHQIGDAATSSSDPVDGDMSAADVLSWPDIPGNGPTAKIKSTSIYHSAPRSLRITDVLEGKGVRVSFAQTVEKGFQICVRAYVQVESGQAHFILYDQDGTTILAERRVGTNYGWDQITLHVWRVGEPIVAPMLEIRTGPAGGNFLVDDVFFYTKQMPWTQWGIGRMYAGRTGGMTDGGSPDDVLTLQISEEVP